MDPLKVAISRFAESLVVIPGVVMDMILFPE